MRNRQPAAAKKTAGKKAASPEKTSAKKAAKKTSSSGRTAAAKAAAKKPETGKPQPTREIKLKDPSLFLNREIAWLEFNLRVLEEACDPLSPAMEKLKFISIFSSNLDEFFQVRVGALARLIQAGVVDPDTSGMTPRQQIEAIAARARKYVAEQYKCLKDIVLPGMREAGIEIVPVSSLDKKDAQKLNAYFENQVFPILTPMAVDAGHPFPFLGNLRLNLMVFFKEVDSFGGQQPYAFVEVPSVLPRVIRVMDDRKGHHFVLLEDLIASNIGNLFPGMKITNCIPFRVTRNQDYDLHEDAVMDLLKSVEAELKDRSNKIAVRLEVQEGTPKKMLQILCRNLDMEPTNVYAIPGPINLCGLMPLYDLPVAAVHRDPPFNPRIPKRLAGKSDIFSVIREGDILIHHPYDSFAVVVEFISAAAEDPDVLAIKQTLYRVDRDSPIVEALCRAAENGKQVTAVVEIKARFDEEKNIDFANTMVKAGINPVFGFVTWKIHCKATLVVRREGKHLRRYVHLSSGNYNSVTAQLYTDVGLLTADPDLGNDVASLFNVITGFNSWTGGDMLKPETVETRFKKIFLAPVNIQDRIIGLIEREIARSTPNKPGRIIAKMNALIDWQTIRALYRASQAGVQIDLIVRGICCLLPGIPGVSENIRVRSILDRFLEHSRIYYFHNGGEPEIYSGSADWMPRNFKKRAEILYPIRDEAIKTRIIDEILMTYLKDKVKARIMQPDGTYQRVKRGVNEKEVRSQSALIAIARKGGVKSPPYSQLVRQIGKKKGKKK
ncbi:MAG TPA: polyphosphate kinase 1 [Syntrophales bacterium]|nr:polyphosphate kinase 1 [Syntrophales bacterium]